METDGCRLGFIEVIGFDGLSNVDPQFIPGVRLGNYVFADGFGYESSIGLLRDFEDEFAHRVTIR